MNLVGSRRSIGSVRRNAALVVALLAVGLAGAWLAACDNNPRTTVLTPPGGRGDIEGTLTFEGVNQPPLPGARILALQSTNCVSQFGAIAVMGTYNDFNLAGADSFLMDQLAPCYWVFSDTIPKGQLDVKFVTGNSPTTLAYDTPPDYGKASANTGADPLEGTLDSPANGPDGNLSVTIPTTGIWTFIVNEATMPATYRITQESLIIESDPQTGKFHIRDLPVGIYEVNIQAPGFLPKQVTSVAVDANRSTDLGALTMEVASGKLFGEIAFADHPDPRPQATVEVRRTKTSIVLQSADTDSAFAFTGLDTGTYDLAITAPGYLDTTLVGIQYDNGTEADLGTITLLAGCLSQFNTIQVAADFTSFTLSQAPFMTQGPNCVWTDTVTVNAGGPYNMKLVTDGAFDNPKDYGGDESQTLPLLGSHPVQLVSGIGTAIHLSVANTGQYVFVLDEANLTFTASLLGGTPTGSITGAVGFSGLSAAPYPKAKVELFPSGGQTAVASVQSDPTTRAFALQAVPNGTYDLKVSANCFLPEQLTSVTVSGTAKDVGTVTLSAGTSPYNQIQVVGDFTGWDLASSPYMTQSPACVWTDTLDFSTGFTAGQEQYFKFITDNTFDSPPDYGGDESQLLGIPGTYPVRVVSSGNAIRIQITQLGFYIFTLDERRQTFSAVRYTPPPKPRGH